MHPMRRFLLLFIALPALALHGCASLPDEPPAQITLSYVSNFSGNAARDGLPEGWEQWTLSRF